jgi:hypothetical protein
MPIRRFDVFAEYQRLEGLERGLDEAHAAGYGLWVAKVVASGRAGRAGTKARQAGEPVEGGQRPEATAAQEWHVLGGEPQTYELFDREVVGRMGLDFYRQVFAPAIARAHRQGKSYESVRDAVRKGWTPER